MTQLTVKRVYDPPAPGDGTRILVDRLWPRGVSKDKIDLWLRDLAPSDALRHELHGHPTVGRVLRRLCDRARQPGRAGGSCDPRG